MYKSPVGISTEKSFEPHSSIADRGSFCLCPDRRNVPLHLGLNRSGSTTALLFLFTSITFHLFTLGTIDRMYLIMRLNSLNSFCLGVVESSIIEQV